MSRFNLMLAALCIAALPSCLRAQTSQDLSDALDSVFTLVGGGAPFTLVPKVPVDFPTCGRAVHAYMVGKGYTNSGSQSSIDALSPWPVTWLGCDSGAINGGAGIELVMSVSGQILLGTGFDGDANSPNGTNAYVEADGQSTGCTVYAVGGLPYSGGGAANGGWAVARDDSGGGGGGEAYGALGLNAGTGGLANGRSLSASVILIGGDSHTGNAGSASTDGGVGVNVLAIGGTAGSTGNGGDVTITAAVGNNVDTTGGDSIGGNGGSVTTNGGGTVGGNLIAVGGTTTGNGDGGGITVNARVSGNVTATAGDTTGAGNGGSITINARVDGDVTAICGSTSGAGNGGGFTGAAAAASDIFGNLDATAGDSGSGTGGSVTAGSLGASGRVQGTAIAVAGSGSVAGAVAVYSYLDCTVTAGDGSAFGGAAEAHTDGGGHATANGGFGATRGGDAIATTAGGTRGGNPYTGGNAIAVAGNSSATGTGGDATALADPNGVGCGFGEATGGSCPAGGFGGDVLSIRGNGGGPFGPMQPLFGTPHIGATAHVN